MRATVTAFLHMSGKNQWTRELFFLGIAFWKYNIGKDIFV
jgi:hypothetical protein